MTTLAAEAWEDGVRVVEELGELVGLGNPVGTVLVGDREGEVLCVEDREERLREEMGLAEAHWLADSDTVAEVLGVMDRETEGEAEKVLLSVPDWEETRLAEAAPELVTVSVTVVLGVVDWEPDVDGDTVLLSVPDREDTRLAEANWVGDTVPLKVPLRVVDWETDVEEECVEDGEGSAVKTVPVMVGLLEGERELVALLKPDTVMDTE